MGSSPDFDPGTPRPGISRFARFVLIGLAVIILAVGICVAVVLTNFG
jgi:hypothetical protein